MKLPLRLAALALAAGFALASLLFYSGLLAVDERPAAAVEGFADRLSALTLAGEQAAEHAVASRPR